MKTLRFQAQIVVSLVSFGASFQTGSDFCEGRNLFFTHLFHERIVSIVRFFVRTSIDNVRRRPYLSSKPSLPNPSSSDLSEDVANTSVFRSFLRRGSDYVIFIVCWSFGQLEAFVRSVFAVSHAESSGGENKSGLRFQCRSSYPEMDFVRPLASFPSSHRLRGAIDADLP